MATVSFALSACTPVENKVQQLYTPSDGVLVLAPSVSGQTASEYYVDGYCHKKTTDIQFSFDGGNNWQSANESILVTNFQLSCDVDKMFSFKLNLSSFTGTSLSLRAQTTAGFSSVISKPVALDNTAPTGTLTAEGGATTISSLTTVLEYQSSDLDIFKIYVTNQASCSSGSLWRFLDNKKLPWTFTGTGPQTLFYKTMDFARNESACNSVTINVSSTVAAPTALTLIFPLSSISNEVTPTIRVDGVDAGDFVYLYTGSDCSAGSLVSSGVSAGSTINLNASIAGLDGTYNFYAKRQNGFGANSACSTASLSYQLDRLPPANPSVQITGNPSGTNSQFVDLTIFADSGPQEMFVTNSADCSTGGTWIAYATSLPAWALTSGDGNKTVKVKFKDTAGNISSCASASVTLDTRPPALTGLTNQVNPVTNHTWNWSCDEAPCTYEFIVDTVSDTSLQDYNFTATQTYSISLGSPDAFYYLHIRARDSAGNISATSRYLAVVGNFPNTPTALTLNSPASSTSPITTPTIAVAGTTSGEVISLHTNSDCSEVAIASNTATGSTTLLTPTLSTDQVYTFYARAFNGSNYSSCSLASLTYTLDRVPPTTPTGLTDGSFALRSYSPYLSWQPSTDSLSGLARYEIQLESIAPVTVIRSWAPIGLVTNYTYNSLTLTAGTSYRVVLRAVDLAGNVSTSITSDGWTAKAEDTLGGPICFVSSYAAAGEIKSATIDGSTAYVGGQFSGVGNCHGGLVLLDGSGNFVSTYALAGDVAGMIEDSSGGIIVYGNFSFKLGAYSSKNILRIKSDTTVDTNFNISINGEVTAAAIVANNLYLAGSFTSINGSTRNYFALIDITDTTNPLLSSYTVSVSNSTILGFYHDSLNNDLYTYGTFTSFAGSSTRKYLVRFTSPHLPTPTLDTAWVPVFDNVVRAVTSIGNTIFIGGSFFKIGGVDSRFITKMDRSTGNFTTVGNALSSSTSTSYNVRRLLVKNSELFAEFYSSLYRLNQSTLGPLHTISVSMVRFNILGETNSGILINSTAGVKEVDVSSGTSLSYGPYNMPTWAGIPRAVKKVGASNYLLGGEFTVVGPLTSRANLAALNITNGSLLPWQPTTNSLVNKILSHGSNLYVGGVFTTASGIATNRVSKIDKISGNILPSEVQTESTALDLAIINNKIIVAGPFAGINSTSRTRLGGVDLTTGQVLNWDPFPSSDVTHLKKMGSQLFVVGDFSSILGNTRSRLAILDSSLNLTNSVMNSQTSVRIETDDDNIVGTSFYEDGNYRTLSYYDSNLNLIWRTNATSAYTNYINLKMNTTNIFMSYFYPNNLALDSVTIPAYSMIKIPRSNTLTLSTSWNPQFGGTTIAPLDTSSGLVLVGGNFKYVNSVPRSGFAIIPDTGNGDPPY